jgi:hypothetical protein
MLAAISFTLAVGVLYAQSITPAPPSVDQRSWSELAAMVAVLGGVFGLFHWVIARAIIQPQIQASIKMATEEIMASCLEQFTSKYAFMLHEQNSKSHHEAFGESLEQIVKNQDVENERLADVRERVRALEAYRRRQQ